MAGREELCVYLPVNIQNYQVIITTLGQMPSMGIIGSLWRLGCELRKLVCGDRPAGFEM
jgi:hypothetical protein